MSLLDRLFETVFIPPEVRDEILVVDNSVRGIAAIRGAFAADMIEVLSLTGSGSAPNVHPSLHRGEVAAITLMQEVSADFLLLDDRQARGDAERLGMSVIGTIGVLQLARDADVIPAVAPLVRMLRGFGFRVSAELLAQVEQDEQLHRP